METVTEFLDELANRGVKLSAQEGRIQCHARSGALTTDLKDGILRFKPELLALLARMEAKRSPAAGGEQQPRGFPLSSGQKGLYLLQRRYPRMSAYNVPLCFRISAGIEPALLDKAWGQVLDEYPILTARIFEEGADLVQRPDERCRTSLQQYAVDFTSDEQLVAALRERVKRPFDLSSGPLTRIELFVPPGQKPVLLLTVHHIVFDGASAVITLKALIERYLQLAKGRTTGPQPPRGNYREFVAWEEAMLASAEGGAHARYWQRQLEGHRPGTELPPDGRRKSTESFTGDTLVEALPADLCQWIREFSKAQSLPSSVIFLAVFQLLLHRHTDQDDIVVGMPVMGRPSRQFSAEVGYFINLVPICTRFGESIELPAFLRKVRGTMLDALYHSSYPFPLMIEGLHARRNDDGPLLRISYAYQNFVRPADFLSMLQQETFQLESVAGVWQEGDFELGLEVYEGEGESFNIHIKHDPELYSTETIARLFSHYCALLSAIRADPTRSLETYPMLPDGERPLPAGMENPEQGDADQSLHGLLLEQASRCGESVAVVCGETQLTYAQLEDESRQLALYLQTLGVGPDRPVALCMTRSAKLVVSVLGVLRAGGACLPLDPDDPDERLTAILRNSDSAVVLTEEPLRERLVACAPSGICFVAVDGDAEQIASRATALQAAGVALKSLVAPGGLAYVLYTSGPEDEPLGVELPHRALVSLLRSMRDKTGITRNDTFMALAPASLDAAVLELLLPLAAGARLVLSARDLRHDAVALLKTLRTCGATMLQATPSTWRGLLAARWSGNPKLTMLSAGEALPRGLAHRLLETGGPLWSLYGAAETATVASASLVKPGSDALSMGDPLTGMHLSVADRHGHLQPTGVRGELHVSGAGVARGYRNRPDWTAAKFSAFGDSPERTYRTGERVLRRSDGRIQHAGRTDRKILIDGIHVHLQEIEAHLNRHPDVQESAVLVLGRAPHQRLTAAYRCKSTKPERVVALPEAELREHLRRTLRESIIPVAFISVGVIPRNFAGEVDQRALVEVVRKRQLSYWREKLADVPPALMIPSDFPEPSRRNSARARYELLIDAQVSAGLESLAALRGGTLFTILLAAFKVLLYRYTGQTDLFIGSRIGDSLEASTNEDDPSSGHVVALRTRAEPEDTFSAFHSRVKTTWADAIGHQDVSFERVADLLRTGGENLLTIMFSRQGWREEGTGEVGRDIEMRVAETVDGVAGFIEYNPLTYESATIARIAGHFSNLCRAIVAKPSGKICDLEFLSEAERHRVLIEYNEDHAVMPTVRHFLEMFGGQVANHSDRPAVNCGDLVLSYAELDRRSRELAVFLQSAGLARGGTVALGMARSSDMMIGIMGTAIAGGTCVPLDLGEPDARLAAMLQDSGASIVLTQETFKYRLAALAVRGARLISLDRQWAEIEQYAADPQTKATGLRSDGQADDGGFILFSHGVAGKPAGVRLGARVVATHIAWMQARRPLGPGDIVLHHSPSGQVTFLWELLWPMAAGATVVFAQAAPSQDARRLGDFIDQSGVTTLWLGSALLRALQEEGVCDGGKVRSLFWHGDPLDRESVLRLRARFPEASLDCVYGPVEAGGAVTVCDGSEQASSLALIGWPVRAARVYILDPANRPQPIGVAGQLFVGGETVAAEYLNRAALTKDFFVENPFEPGLRMFRTADRARWREDGSIQYLGKT